MALAFRFARMEPGLLSAFVLLSVFSVATESLGLALLIPLLDVLSDSSELFRNIPILAVVSDFFQRFPADERFFWAAGFVLVIVLLRGILSLFVEVLSYSIPVQYESRLKLSAAKALLSSRFKAAQKFPVEKLASYTIEFPARVGIAMRFFAMFISNLTVLLFYVTAMIVLSPRDSLGLGVIALVVAVTLAIAYRALTVGIGRRIADRLTKEKEGFGKTFYEQVNGARDVRVFNARSRSMRAIGDRIPRDRCAA